MPAAVDSEILTLLGRRDARGFDLAYATYAARVHAFLRRLSGRADVADDLLQHTFMRLAERGPELRADSDVRAWLFTVARNAYLSARRAAGEELISDGLEAVTSRSPDVEARLLLGDVERALAALRIDDRELLLLVGVEGLEPADVAVVLAVDAATLRKRLERARSRLLAALENPRTLANSRKAVP